MADYLRRTVDDEIDEIARSLPALALEGAKGVGKTATALQRAATVFRLEDPALRSIMEADPARLVTGAAPILIDEWQRIPEVWDRVRRAVDDGAPPGQFLLTGSAPPTTQPMHSGAGCRVCVTSAAAPCAPSSRAICSASSSATSRSRAIGYATPRRCDAG